MKVEETQRSELFIKSGIFCLKTSGNPYKIGYQHGTLLKEHIRNGAYKYFSEYLNKIVKSDRRTKTEPFARLVLRFLKGKAQKYIQRLPREIKDEIRGLCDGAGIDYNLALESYVFPELICYLISKYTGDNFASNTHLSGEALLGCTSVVASNDATDTGELIHGRNFDCVGIGFWEKYPLVSYVYPDDGNSYISVSSAGIVGGIVSGINEKHITYALHQNYSKEYSEENLPILSLGVLVMKYADSLEKAEEIIRSSKSTSSWSVVVTDNVTRDAFVAEICGNDVKIVKMENETLICTNSFISPELHEKEIIINPIFNLSSNTRYQRARDLVSGKFNQINPEFIAKILGDRFDITSEKERIFGYTVSQNHTLSSVIFAPERETLWVAGGNIPPVSNTDYIPFNFNFEKNKETLDPVLESSKFKLKNNEEALGIIMKAHEAYENKDYKKALNFLLNAINFCGTEEPTLQFLCGILHIKLDNFEKASEHLTTAYDNERDIYRSGIIKLWLGRVYDLLGNRPNALKHYRYVELLNKKVYGHIADLASKGIKSPYKKKYIRYIRLDIWHGEELTTQ